MRGLELTRVNPKNIFNLFLYNYNFYSSSAWSRVDAGWDIIWFGFI